MCLLAVLPGRRVIHICISSPPANTLGGAKLYLGAGAEQPGLVEQLVAPCGSFNERLECMTKLTALVGLFGAANACALAGCKHACFAARMTWLGSMWGVVVVVVVAGRWRYMYRGNAQRATFAFTLCQAPTCEGCMQHSMYPSIACILSHLGVDVLRTAVVSCGCLLSCGVWCASRENCRAAFTVTP